MTRSRKSEHIKEKILEEGVELLSEYGYHGTGLKKILDTVNVPKGSFYNYFVSKEVFVSEIIKKYCNDIEKRLDDYINSTDEDPVTIIRNIFEFSIVEHEKNHMKGCLIGNLAAEIGRSSQLCHAQMENGVKLWEKRLSHLFEDAQKQELLRNDITALQMAEIYWTIFQGGLLKLKINGNMDQLKDMLDIILNSFFKP